MRHNGTQKNVVVFGGSGFLGSHVADSLTANGYRVTVFDRVESPYLCRQQKMICGDIINVSQVMDAVNDADAVYHFAGIADIKKANEHPLEAVKYNVLGTANVLEACVAANVSRIIYASTVYIYSDQGGVYRSTKQASELLIENYQKLYGLDFTILRFGSLYGRRANEFNWIRQIIRQALTEGRMQRKGDGEEIRDYIHVNDAAQAAVDMLKEAYENEYIILSGSQTIKIKELLTMIREMLNSKVEIEFLNGQIDEHYQITPYSFRPRVARKYIRNTQVELGQGLLDIIYDTYKELNGS